MHLLGLHHAQKIFQLLGASIFLFVLAESSHATVNQFQLKEASGNVLNCISYGTVVNQELLQILQSKQWAYQAFGRPNRLGIPVVNQLIGSNGNIIATCMGQVAPTSTLAVHDKVIISGLHDCVLFAYGYYTLESCRAFKKKIAEGSLRPEGVEILPGSFCEQRQLS